MTFQQELWRAIGERHPDAVWIGNVCYLRLGIGVLAKIEPISGSGYYDGLQLTVLNRLSGPVDSVSLRIWDLPHHTGVKRCGESEGWDICRPSPDITALTDVAEEYLRLFREPGTR
jgi:hypothetical protein